MKENLEEITIFIPNIFLYTEYNDYYLIKLKFVKYL